MLRQSFTFSFFVLLSAIPAAAHGCDNSYYKIVASPYSATIVDITPVAEEAGGGVALANEETEARRQEVSDQSIPAADKAKLIGWRDANIRNARCLGATQDSAGLAPRQPDERMSSPAGQYTPLSPKQEEKEEHSALCRCNNPKMGFKEKEIDLTGIGRDQWQSYAERQCAAICPPEFSQQDYDRCDGLYTAALNANDSVARMVIAKPNGVAPNPQGCATLNQYISSVSRGADLLDQRIAEYNRQCSRLPDLDADAKGIGDMQRNAVSIHSVNSGDRDRVAAAGCQTP